MSEQKSDARELRKLLSDKSLLYVEDNNGLRGKALKLFEKLFPVVYEASDGAEGLELFRAHAPDFVITDISMPNLNGIEMANEIKKLEPKTKILITSAYDNKEYLLSSIELKIDAYLIKPVTVEKLIAALYDIAAALQQEE